MLISIFRMTSRITSFVFISGILLTHGLSQTIPVQTSSMNRVRIYTLIDQADSLLAAHKFVEAKSLYQLLIDRGDTTDLPLIRLGMVAMAQESWSDAVEWFEKAVKVAPDDIEARYELGRAHGERGREMYVLEKLFSFLPSSNFKQAERDFQWVLSKDSTYRDALYQFALVYRYKREYPEAIAFALKQIEVKPELRQGHLGLFKIYREAIGIGEQKSPLEQLTHPKNDYDRYFIAEWQRRNGELGEAEKNLRALLSTPGIVRPTLIWESLSRIGARREKDEDTQQCFTKAVDAIQTLGDADLVFEDIKYIVTAEELRQYRSLTSIAEARKFFAEFWTKRNPFPAQSVNVRIGEHYRRLVYAEDHYQYFGRKTYAHGFDNDVFQLTFSETYYLNEEFDDRGVIYVRHGAPDRKIVTSNDGKIPTLDSAPGEPASQNESWLYSGNSEFPEMLFDFYIPPNAHISDWRLVPVLSNSMFWSDRAMYSNKYSRLQYAPTSPLSVSGNLALSMEEGKRTVKTGVTTERHSFEKEMKYFESPISVTCYRGSRGKTLVHLGYVISRADMAKEIPDSIEKLNISAKYSMYDPSWKQASSGHKSQVYGRTGKEGNAIIEIFHATVAPDSYVVAWEAKLEAANVIVSNKVKAQVRDFSGPSLNMSDIELAYAIEPATPGNEFNKGVLSVVPNPLRRSSIDRPLHVYFEAYNLTKDPTGRTSYTIEYGLTRVESPKSFLSGIFSSDKKTTITVRPERSGNKDWSAEHIDIDVSKLVPGKYELRVKLTDKPTGISISRSLKVEIYQPE
jgi:GWxTD domain-containing protein